MFNFHSYSNVRADLKLMHLFNAIVSMILVVRRPPIHCNLTNSGNLS